MLFRRSQLSRDAKNKLVATRRLVVTGINDAGGAGDTSPNILVGERQREYPPNIITYFRI